MDYGDGIYQGTYQFNTQYRKAQMCSHINSKVNSCSTHFYQDEDATNPTPTVGPTPMPTEGPTGGPMAWEFVQGSASGTQPQPHCHYSKLNVVCNAANNGKVYYGNAWDAVGGDITSLGSCDGGWFNHGPKPVDRKFTCQAVPAPAPTPAPQFQFLHSSASGFQPEPHCNLINYSPVCNAENEGKSYYSNYADAVGGDVQELGECGNWFNHGSKQVDSKFTCTYVGGATTDAPTDAPSPEGTMAPGPEGPEGPSGPPGPPGFQGPPGPPR